MTKKILLLGLMVLSIIMCTSMVTAQTPNVAPYPNGLAYGYAGYGSWPVNPAITGRQYAQTTPRIGGFFGQNSAFTIGLKPGIYDGPIYTTGTRHRISSMYYQPVRAGGWFGNRAAYYSLSLRPGTFAFY